MLSKLPLIWRRFTTLTSAREAFASIPCVYVQTNRRSRPIRIGKASGGLRRRYWGGTGYALDAAMHGSGNLIFVAKVPRRLCDLVERNLIWRYRESLPYNNVGKKIPPRTMIRLLHQGRKPVFPVVRPIRRK
jgi:hypothetical protein